jgi:hypothetical protein
LNPHKSYYVFLILQESQGDGQINVGSLDHDNDNDNDNDNGLRQRQRQRQRPAPTTTTTTCANDLRQRPRSHPRYKQRQCPYKHNQFDYIH